MNFFHFSREIPIILIHSTEFDRIRSKLSDCTIRDL